MIVPIILTLVFIVSSIVGYFLIKNVPSLLHTPLMSGMNALSGITLIGALMSVALIFKDTNSLLTTVAGFLAIVAATINVVGGFGITNRMLKMFLKKGDKDE